MYQYMVLFKAEWRYGREIQSTDIMVGAFAPNIMKTEKERYS